STPPSLQLPGSCPPGMLPGSCPPGMLPESCPPGMLPGSCPPGMLPGSCPPGMLPGSCPPGMLPGSCAPEMLPGSCPPGMLPGSCPPGMLPGSCPPGMLAGSCPPGMLPPAQGLQGLSQLPATKCSTKVLSKVIPREMLLPPPYHPSRVWILNPDVPFSCSKCLGCSIPWGENLPHHMEWPRSASWSITEHPTSQKTLKCQTLMEAQLSCHFFTWPWDSVHQGCGLESPTQSQLQPDIPPHPPCSEATGAAGTSWL
uniref:Uncharacterized protein n=1 Tax=Taeniopygia guttata TaxID=59729 RepID=A0A674HR22_TAEGU